jgi:hypothetical protein
MVVVGAVAGKLYHDWVGDKPNGDVAKRLGILLASGLIVGESIFGIVLSAIIVFSNKGTPFAVVGDDFQTAATWIGGIAFVIIVVGLYRWVGGLARKLS